VKQEIAKEGVLPYSLFFARSYDLSLARLFGNRKSSKAGDDSLYSENTPAATLALHWVIANLLVIFSVLAFQPAPPPNYQPTPAYTFLVGVVVYVTNLVKFSLIGFGLLCLRLTPRVRWAEKSASKRPAVSITAASLLFALAFFPMVCLWVPDRSFPSLSRTWGLVDWFVVQTVGVGLIVAAFAYWLSFRAYVAVRSAREGKTLNVKREPKFKVDPRGGGLTQIIEIVTLEWVRESGALTLGQIEEAAPSYYTGGTRSPAPPRVAWPPAGISQLSDDGTAYYVDAQGKSRHELEVQNLPSELSLDRGYVRNRGVGQFQNPELE